MNRTRRNNAPDRAGHGARTGSPGESGAREIILDAVRRAGVPAASLPPVAGVRDADSGDPVSRFAAAARAAASEVRIVETGEVEAAVRERFPEAASVAAAVPAWSFECIDARASARALAQIDVLVCPGELGVAENGAVWLGEAGMGARAAPFLAQHLVLALHRDAIVPDMHAAYERLDVALEGYGLFVAGPSKTADIEQALVIGAHGPRSLTVLLTDTLITSASSDAGRGAPARDDEAV